MNSFMLFVDQCVAEECNYPVLNLLSKWQTRKSFQNNPNTLEEIVTTREATATD
jgi:hypothetical protein